mmetsp:Transcript_20438/g.17785  ORF Transcript_20438/g.17785 Transcript_20438/m.17785 type:complete len:182 (+) Transcript_20438:1733-2278(+)
MKKPKFGTLKNIGEESENNRDEDNDNDKNGHNNDDDNPDNVENPPSAIGKGVSKYNLPKTMVYGTAMDENSGEREVLDKYFDLLYYTKHKDKINRIDPNNNMSITEDRQYTKRHPGIQRKNPDFERKIDRTTDFLKKQEEIIREICEKPDFVYLNKVSKQIRYLNMVILDKFNNLAESEKS